MEHNSATNRAGAQRRRPYLIATMVAAVSVGLLSLAGAFAQATDSGVTGTNRYETGALDEAPDIDLQLADATEAGGCGEFTDNEVSGLFDVHEDFTSPSPSGIHGRRICVRNVGTQDGHLSARAIDLVDTDVDCTEREAEVDATCGLDQRGELSSYLLTTIYDLSDSSYNWLEAWAESPHSLGTLSAGEQRIFNVMVRDSSTLSQEQRRLIQSDRATWRFQFDLTAGPTPVACDQVDAEPNNTMETALLYTGFTQGTICQDDVDWYRFDVGDNDGQEWQGTIELDFSHAEGDLDMELYNSSGNRIAIRASSTDNEIWTGQVTGGNSYFLKVYGYQGRPNPLYDLFAVFTEV